MFLFLIGITFLLNYANANIVYDVNKYGVMMVNFVYSGEDLTTDMLVGDYSKAVDFAYQNPKVKQIQFKDNKGDIIIWANKSDFKILNNKFEELIKDFSKFDIIETIYGDSVLKETIIKAQYHCDTYLNGKLESEYTSDWESGYFRPSTSIYQTSTDIYRKEVYYTPKRKEYKWEVPIKEKRIIRKGEDIKLHEIYKKL